MTPQTCSRAATSSRCDSRSWCGCEACAVDVGVAAAVAEVLADLFLERRMGSSVRAVAMPELLLGCDATATPIRSRLMSRAMTAPVPRVAFQSIRDATRDGVTRYRLNFVGDRADMMICVLADSGFDSQVLKIQLTDMYTRGYFPHSRHLSSLLVDYLLLSVLWGVIE